jgi:integrase
MTETRWSTRKKDNAPRGVRRHPSGVWMIRYTCGAGHIHKEKIGPIKTAATNAYHDRRARARREAGWCPAIERGQARAQEQQSAIAAETVRSYSERWLRTRVALSCRERTLELYASIFRRVILPALDDVPLAELTRQQILDLLAEQGKTRAANGIKQLLTPLRSMLNAAVEDGTIASTPANRIGRRLRGMATREARRVSSFAADELGRLLAEADRNFSDFSDLVHVLAWSGVRTGEACGLRWDDCDQAGALDVKRTISHTRGRVRIGPTKSSKARRVDVPIALVARLDRRRSLAEAEAALEGRDASPWIFPDPHDLSRPLDVRFFSSNGGPGSSGLRDSGTCPRTRSDTRSRPCCSRPGLRSTTSGSCSGTRASS